MKEAITLWITGCLPMITGAIEPGKYLAWLLLFEGHGNTDEQLAGNEARYATNIKG
jgi:hypothetical protein